MIDILIEFIDIVLDAIDIIIIERIKKYRRK